MPSLPDPAGRLSHALMRSVFSVGYLTPSSRDDPPRVLADVVLVV